MSVTTVGARIASVQSDITGVTSAYAHDELPGALRTSELPAFLNFPGEADYTIISDSYVKEVRQWRMQLFVAPRGRDTDPARLGSTIEPFFRRVFLEFLDSIQLESLADVVCCKVLNDTGWIVLEWGGIEYVGIEFVLEVIEKFTVTNYSS